MLKITKVRKKSIAASLGFEIGDIVTAFDGERCVDELDYLYATSKANFTVSVQDSRTGKTAEIAVEKSEGEDLGLEFEKEQKIRTCHNRCVFCFVDQMPKAMRESLYVKDDDYTMSFACGNFVTLTNVTEEELARIVRLQLSPMYVSVHTTNPELRVKLLRNRHAGKILQQIETLAQGGITVHCQAVLVPNENDGEELRRTAKELFAYYPNVRDLACVPTGLTKYRDGLTKIPDIDKEYSARTLDLIDEINAELGVDFLLPADEYFVRAEREMKPIAFYGDFSQIENGIGMTSKFLAEANAALSAVKPKSLKRAKKSLLVCGESAAKTLAGLVEKCNEKIDGLHAELLPVKNEFFGETVTCTGLLTGQDIAKALQNYKEERGSFDEVVLAGNTMKEFEDVFLCGTTLKQLKKQIRFANIRVNRRNDGFGLIEILSSKK
ncbi:MAG: DUF512 domain-containing protein [Clostridiales bacterium]|nr:DUF512 domain-containing protein [Clostridiales bacterium]